MKRKVKRERGKECVGPKVDLGVDRGKHAKENARKAYGKKDMGIMEKTRAKGKEWGNGLNGYVINY